MTAVANLLADLPEIDRPETLFSFLLTCVRRYRTNTAYVYTVGEEEHRVSYQKLLEDILLLATAFKKRGIGRGDKVMLLSDNRYGWIVTDFALMALGAINVPRGSDTPSQELEYIIDHAQCSYLIVEYSELLKRHEQALKGCKRLKSFFVIAGDSLHSIFNNIYSYNELLGERTYTAKELDSFLANGLAHKSDDLLTIIYTSGTTGRPKGVQLSHGNIMHNIGVVPDVIQLTEADSWLSILPSWHIFERTAEYVALARGTTLVYSSVKTFAQDLEHYKPTLVATVPRVWESLYSRVQMAVRKKGPKAVRLFDALIWVCASYKKNKRCFLDRLPVYRRGFLPVQLARRAFAGMKMVALYPLYRLSNAKLDGVRQRFGGRLRLAISGGGTLATYLEEWLDAIGVRIVNAYGMTECSPAIAGRGLVCRTIYTVGPPVDETQLRVVDQQGNTVPTGAEGTIEVKGPQVTRGYYQDEEENRKSFTADGYFKTGDLGRMTVKGELVITGRAKEIIVLSSGENIDPTRIENALTMFPFIKDAVLVGQDKKGLGALLVPNVDELKDYVAEKIGEMKTQSQDLLTDVKVLDYIRNDLNRILKPSQGFKPYEKLQGILFLDKEFKLGEELTNTLKKKRHVIENKYRQLINDLLH